MEPDETESGFRGGQGRTAADVEAQAAGFAGAVVAMVVVIAAFVAAFWALGYLR